MIVRGLGCELKPRPLANRIARAGGRCGVANSPQFSQQSKIGKWSSMANQLLSAADSGANHTKFKFKISAPILSKIIKIQLKSTKFNYNNQNPMKNFFLENQ